MKSFSELLKKKQNASMQKGVDKNTVFFIFNKKILLEYGQSGKRNIVPKKYEKKVLSIIIKKSLWRQEIALTKENVKNYINTSFGEKIVKDIYIENS